MINCNSNYIGIGIGIIRNTRCYNIIFITIHLFGDNILIESYIQWNESILNQTKDIFPKKYFFFLIERQISYFL